MKSDLQRIIYNTVVLGGTFDFLHRGHKAFLSFALAQASHVTIGITSDTYTATHKDTVVASFETRKKNMVEYLLENNSLNNVTIMSIDDMYGPTLDASASIDALVVSSETVEGAETINHTRQDKGLAPLVILIAPDTYDEEGVLISSSRIRSGAIDLDGRVFFKRDWIEKDFTLPKELRPLLAKPWGTVYTSQDISKMKSRIEQEIVITVGDVTSEVWNKEGINQWISIIDFVVERHKEEKTLLELGFDETESVLSATNPNGHVTSGLTSSIVDALQHTNRVIICVQGEEDLAVIPLILLAPLGTFIYYGQPNVGVVEVIVTLEIKRKIYTFFSSWVNN